MVRKSLFALLGLVGGFIAGIIVNELIAVVGYLMLGQSSWLRALKYIPGIFSVLCAAAAFIWVPARGRVRGER